MKIKFCTEKFSATFVEKNTFEIDQIPKKER